MGDFTVIETQDQLDKVISERIRRERETIQKQYEGYLSPEAAKKQYEGYLSPEEEEKKYKGFLSPEEAARRDATIRKYETDSVKTRIAIESGLPYEMAQRLQGEDDEAIRKDAEALSRLIASRKPQAPLADPEGNKSGKDAALKKVLNQLNGKGE